MPGRFLSADEMAALVRPSLVSLPIGIALAIPEWEGATNPARPDLPNVRGFDTHAGPPGGRAAPITSARGVYQIVFGSEGEYGLARSRTRDGILRGPAGEDLGDDPTDPRFDVALAAPGAAKVFERFLLAVDASASSRGLTVEPDDRAALVYYGHSEGEGALSTVLRRLEAQGLPITLASALTVRQRVNKGGGLEFVRARWRYWQKRYGDPGLGGQLLGAALLGGTLWGIFRLVVAIVGRA